MRSPLHLVQTHLDVPSRLEEILFGLVMVMTVTLTAGSVVSSGPEGVRQLLLAAVGCNIAWGVIDGMMFVMSEVTTRARNAVLIDGVRHAPTRKEARSQVRAEAEARLGPLLSDCIRDDTLDDMAAAAARALPPRIAVTADDLRGGAACFLLVFVSCLPAAVPFLVLSDPVTALRVSNALLIVMLFFAGLGWASYTGANRIAAGLSAVALGLALVLVAVLLGG